MFMCIILILALTASSQLEKGPWIELPGGSPTDPVSLNVLNITTTTLVEYNIQQKKTPYNLTFAWRTYLFNDKSDTSVGWFGMVYKMSGFATSNSSLGIGTTAARYCWDPTVLQGELPEQITWDLVSSNVATVNSSAKADFSGCSYYEDWMSLVESGTITRAVIDHLTVTVGSGNVTEYLTLQYRLISRPACDKPDIANGTVSPEDATIVYNSTYSVVCNKGYTVSSETTMTCTADGTLDVVHTCEGLNIPAIVGGSIAGGVLLIIIIMFSAYFIKRLILKRRESRIAVLQVSECGIDLEIIFERNLPTLAHGQTHVFLTHDWGRDLGQNNHERVSFVNNELKKRGYKTWFDEDKMTGNIVDKMCEGVDNTRVVLVFVTQRYCEKAGGTDANDNCKLEFNYALRQKKGTHMLPIVMEERMKDPSKWTGALGMALGGTIYVDFTGNNQQILNTFAKLESEIASRIYI